MTTECVPIPLAGASIERVLVGVDDTEAGLAALATATRLARSHGAQLIAVRAWALGLPRHGGRRMRNISHPHVILSFSGTEQCQAARVLIKDAFIAALGQVPQDLPVAIKIPESDPGLALVRLADRPGDVIVVGTTSGRAGRRLVHGSVSKYCQRHARCPVVVVQAGHVATA